MKIVKPSTALINLPSLIRDVKKSILNFLSIHGLYIEILEKKTSKKYLNNC